MNNSIGIKKKRRLSFFSVVVPVYNKEPHIYRSINSVLKQSFGDFELIIVCDPSTDNSNEEIAKFDDPRIRVLYREQPGPGGYAARNLGITNAKSDWIAFLDADDEWYPDHLNNVYQSVISNDKCSIISCGWKIYEHDAYRLDNYSRRNAESHTISFSDYLSSEINFGRPIWTSVACIKKAVLVEAGMFPEGKITMGGDVDTWLRCIEAAQSMYWSKHIGAIYFTDSINMVTKTSIIDPDLHHQTLMAMLNKDYSDEIIRKLKIRYNNLLTVAWNRNMHMLVDENFVLRGKLFFKVQPVKSGFYTIFSSLPLNISKPIHSITYSLLKLKRKLV
ncbi:glycosyltransferase family A protein [Psychrobacter submarinus]|uniref:glycosyltransferase family A protein n=1 Tax=Psychrobacter submarinus TaxID=154108 RepID=UPI0019183B16|nr:glycosyltransferase family A protein [Psychrobacter submarinus]